MTENKLVIGLVRVTLIIMLSFVGVIAYFLMYKKIPLNSINNTTQATTTDNKSRTSPLKEKTASIEEVIINLADSNSTYLKAKISIGYDAKNKKLDKEITEKTSQVRDCLIRSLRTVTETDIDSNLDDVNEKVIAEINGILINGQISNIYFEDLLIAKS